MKKILIVVDYQNDFVTGSLGFADALKIEKKIINHIKRYKKEGSEICITKDVHDKNYLKTVEGRKLPIKHCIEETSGIDIFGKVKEQVEGCKVFYKNTFGSYELGHYLRDNNYQEIALVGVVSNICVLTNAIIAKTFVPNSRIIVYKDAVASNDLDMQEVGFKILQNLHIEVI